MNSPSSAGFSALQRAENSSIGCDGRGDARRRGFSALQRAENSSINDPVALARRDKEFQCSSASRKFLNLMSQPRTQRATAFQCSSASRKFLNAAGDGAGAAAVRVSVLFSEPKIPQSSNSWRAARSVIGFSALQRAENSSIPTLAPASIHIPDCDDHASSFLSLPGASP